MPPVFCEVKFTMPGLSVKQEIVAAAIERQILYLLLADEAGDVLGRAVDDRDILGDGYLLLNLSHLQCKISGGILTDDKKYPRAHLFGKAVFFRVKLVVSDRQFEKLILPSLISECGT